MKNLSTIRYALGALVFALQAMGAEPAPAPADAPAVQTDGKLPPVARVGKEIISGEEFQRDLELRIRRVEMQTRAPFAPDREFRLATLTDLINGKVLSILAESAAIPVSEEEVRKEFEARRSSLPSDAAYQNYLKQEGLTEEQLLERIRRRMRTDRFIEEKTKDIAIADDAVQTEYDRWVKDGKMDRQTTTADFAHILVRASDDDSKTWDAAKQKVEAARKRIQDGEDFEKVAKEVSDDVISAPRGGTYFEATEEVVLPEMAERLFTLKPRELSGPFRTRSGWHIMKVLQLNKPGRVPYEKVREELRQNLMVEAREERIAELVKGARNVMEIEVFRTPEDSSNTEGSKKEQAGGVNGAAS